MWVFRETIHQHSLLATWISICLDKADEWADYVDDSEEVMRASNINADTQIALFAFYGFE